MKIQNFFVEEKLEGKMGGMITDKKMIHQWLKVFRYREGDRVKLFDNTGNEYLCEISQIEKEAIYYTTLSMKKRLRKNKFFMKFSLVVSLPKKGKLEWIVQKATELGVSRVMTVISERTEKLSFNKDRLWITAREAAEQSDRPILPEIFSPVSLEDFLKEFGSEENIFYLDFDASLKSKKVFSSIHEVIILVGPEGGWGEKDKKLFEKYKIRELSLGEQILRSETAAIAVCALFLLE